MKKKKLFFLDSIEFQSEEEKLVWDELVKCAIAKLERPGKNTDPDFDLPLSNKSIELFAERAVYLADKILQMRRDRE